MKRKNKYAQDPKSKTPGGERLTRQRIRQYLRAVAKDDLEKRFPGTSRDVRRSIAHARVSNVDFAAFREREQRKADLKQDEADASQA